MEEQSCMRIGAARLILESVSTSASERVEHSAGDVDVLGGSGHWPGLLMSAGGG